tara:strand:+ start:1639 stop:1866 length:228 start_codon:yes stop_codon:yes gene_type:complete
MKPIDSSTLTDLAYNFHYHGAGTISLEDLEKRGWATKEHIAEIMKQVNAYIGMWEDTLMNIHDALNELRDREMSE